MSARRVPVNAAALLAARVFGASVTVAVVAIAAHRLSAAQFGLVASTMAAGFLANTLITFGTDTLITRSIAAGACDAAAIGRASLKLQLAASMLVATLAAVGLRSGLDTAVFVQALALVPLSGVTVGAAVLRGQQRMDRLLVGAVGGGIATLASLLVIFSRYQAPWVPLAALLTGSTVTAAISLGYSWSALRTGQGSAPVADLSRQAAPFAAMVFLAALTAQAGPVLVEFASDESAGGYGVAVRVTEAARLVPAAAMGAFFPAMMTGLHHTERYRRWIKWLLLYGVAATGATFVLAAPINDMVFDSQPGGAALMRILALGTTVTVIRLAASFELIAAGRETVVLASAFVGALLSLAGGLALAARFGPQGIAWAQVAGLGGAVLVLLVARASQTNATASTLVRVGKPDVGHDTPE